MTQTAANQLGDRAVVGKIGRRLIPFLCLLFIVNYLDRTNVSMAKLKMLGDLNLDEKVYGLGAGLFFIGYFIFEIPSNLILHKVGARRWIARIMITWGLCSAAMMFVRGARSFYAIRILIGLAEAGFFPGIVLYLSFWVPARQRAKIMAAFLTSTALSGVIGLPLGGTIMRLDGIGGLHGWQWLYLIEGIVPVLLGILILITPLLPDYPKDAKWLTGEQKDWIRDQLEQDANHPHVNHVSELFAAGCDWRLWLLGVIYFCVVMGLYELVLYTPSIITEIYHTDSYHTGLIGAIPFIVATVGMMVIAYSADHTRKRRLHICASAVIAAVGLIMVARLNGQTPRMIALCVSSIGVFGTLGPFWTLPTRYLRGTAAAGGIALVNSLGAIAGLVAPAVTGSYKMSTGHYTGGLLFVAANLLAGAVLVMCVPRKIDC